MSRVILAGGRNIAVSILSQLLTSRHTLAGIICRSDDTGHDEVFPSLLKRARDLGIPHIVPARVNAPAAMEGIARFDGDVVISAMYNQVFRAPLLDAFSERLGIVNIHYAPLPKYSGFWPEMWAIWNAETQFGVTIHYIDEGIDTGDVIAQSMFGIEENETRRSLYKKCDAAANELFADASPRFLDERSEARPQDHAARTYYGRELPNGGFVDPSWDYATISRFIRATSFDPFVGAKFRFGDRVFSVLDRDFPFFEPYRIT